MLNNKILFHYCIVGIFLLSISCQTLSSSEKVKKVPNLTKEQNFKVKELYQELKLKKYLDYDIFRMAYTGYLNISTSKKDILTIIDFTKPSNKKRFFVLDLKQKKVLFATVTSHGVNSGDLFATQFSNKPNSRKTCIGFFLTDDIYIGKNGYSLRINGLEKGINQHARKRAIVIHPADYVSKEYIQKHGKVGNSWGCPALPHSVSKQIIDTIKNGSCLFAYGKDNKYKSVSYYIPKTG